MPYINSDGKITIDEAVALADVAKTLMAVQTLKGVASKLRALASEADGFDGETASAISEKAKEMLQKTNALISNLEQSAAYTKRVVAHYKEVDRKCREMVESGI